MPQVSRAAALAHITETVARDGKDGVPLLRYAQANRIGIKAYNQAVHAGYRRHEVEVLRPAWLLAR